MAWWSVQRSKVTNTKTNQQTWCHVLQTENGSLVYAGKCSCFSNVLSPVCLSGPLANPVEEGAGVVTLLCLGGNSRPPCWPGIQVSAGLRTLGCPAMCNRSLHSSLVLVPKQRPRTFSTRTAGGKTPSPLAGAPCLPFTLPWQEGEEGFDFKSAPFPSLCLPTAHVGESWFLLYPFTSCLYGIDSQSMVQGTLEGTLFWGPWRQYHFCDSAKRIACVALILLWVCSGAFQRLHNTCTII